MSMLHAEYAWLGGDSVVSDVLIEVTDGVIAAVTPAVTHGAPAPYDAVRLPGLTMPGLVNTHSHVFHRAIRGHSQSGVADFWAWRDLMYGVAGRCEGAAGGRSTRRSGAGPDGLSVSQRVAMKPACSFGISSLYVKPRKLSALSTYASALA